MDKFVKWCSKKYKSSIVLLILVLQADAKAHNEDQEILSQVMRVTNDIPFVIVLNQVDKIIPSREPLRTSSWDTEQEQESQKSRNIYEKVMEVSRQFGLDHRRIEPSVSTHLKFNKGALEKLIFQHIS